MKQYIVKNHYYYTRTGYISINKEKENLKCIGYCNDKSSFRKLIRKEFEASIEEKLTCNKIYWAFTHKFFVDIIKKRSSIKMIMELKFPFGKRDVTNLIQYWGCEECKTCNNKECYIPKYISQYNKKKLKPKENILIIFKKIL